MSILSSLTIDKNLELNARKWYFRNNMASETQKVRNDFFAENKADIIKEYLNTFPKVAKRYEERRKQLHKIALFSTIGTIAIGGALCYSCSKSPLVPGSPETEQETSTSNDISPYDMMYNLIYNNVDELDDADSIHEYTKELILKCYNRENPNNQVSISNFGIIISNPNFLTATTDSLGNITSYRIGPANNGDIIVDGKTVYQFLINNHVVSCYDKMGQKILNDDIVSEVDLSKYINLVNKSETLKNMFIYPSNDTEKLNAKKEYTDAIVNTLYPDINKDIENSLTLE